MKKLLLLACIISYTFNLSAQCESTLPVSENFSDIVAINICWNFIDDDGDGYGWYVASLSGNNGLVSESYTGPTGYLTPDNWAITNAIDLTGYSNVQLNWKVRTPDWSFDQERYTVYAATGPNMSDFTASSVSVFENLDDSDAAGLNYADRSLNISSLSGNVVYIAFRHWASVFQNQINIDDMVITATLGVDDFETTSFKHFYNPSTDVLTLKSSNTPIDTIEIFNILGQRALTRELSQSNETINLSSLIDGIYIAQVRFENFTKTIKFLKQ